MAESKTLELHYFDGPGRAELIRTVLKVGGYEFKDNRIAMADFGALKADPESLPNQCFGSVPIVVHGDLTLAQSGACQMYAAELALGSAKLTAAQRAKDAMVAATYADLQAAMYKCMFGDDAAKAEGAKALPATVAKLMGGLERAYPATGYLHGGDTPSLGDLALFDIVNCKFPGLKALKADLAPYTKINAMLSTLAEYAPLKAYVAERGF